MLSAYPLSNNRPDRELSVHRDNSHREFETQAGGIDATCINLSEQRGGGDLLYVFRDKMNQRC